MKIGVLANDNQWNEMLPAVADGNFYRINTIGTNSNDWDAYLVLQEGYNVNFEFNSPPVIVNAVVTTLHEMKAAGNVVRINGWNGFLQKDRWEAAGIIDPFVEQIFSALGKQLVPVPDSPGFVTARVIAMIINEAYFALEDNISSKEEIDIAMKLGTNYPFGPFEWAALIGEEKIYYLLDRLSKDDKRYLPASLLKSAIRQ